MHDVSGTLPARPTVGLLERARASSLAVDLVVVSCVSLALGLIRLGTPSLWFDESYTVEKIKLSYGAQVEGYQPIYYWIEKP